MYKIYSGLLRKVPTEEMFEKSLKNEIDLKEVTLEETVRMSNTKEPKPYLLFRLSYQESTNKGESKYILNEETQEFEKVYKLTPIIAGYGKELRILTSYGENVPVKVVVFEKEKEGKRLYDLICVQDQRVGTIEN